MEQRCEYEGVCENLQCRLYVYGNYEDCPVYQAIEGTIFESEHYKTEPPVILPDASELGNLELKLRGEEGG